MAEDTMNKENKSCRKHFDSYTALCQCTFYTAQARAWDKKHFGSSARSCCRNVLAKLEMVAVARGKKSCCLWLRLFLPNQKQIQWQLHIEAVKMDDVTGDLPEAVMQTSRS